ncbi:hypothetical protein AKUA2103_PHAGE100560 (plasmid) [Apilactobacillus kunkeei]|nr:hypothetical protein AKUA2103_PHAGE100560 [Apilactobacillus kunkeei]CAI2699808.1 hypothetical protein AKUA1003_PHAGE100560 [Apilactobacillus kunkeei]
MASYNTPIITTQGQSLLKATIANNDTMTFTKIVFSSDDYSQSTDSNVASLTALSSLDLTATARAFVDVNGNLKIRGIANNQNTTSAFYIKTYGLYVKNSAGTEMLFAVATTQNANFVPAYNNKQTNQVAYTFNLAISSTSNITLSNQSDVDVTQADIASINSAVNSNASSLTATQSSFANSMNSAFSANSSNNSGYVSSTTNSLTSYVSSNVSNVQSQFSSNATNIANNSSAISSLSSSAGSAIGSNATNIANNSSAISNLQSSVANNSSAISSNAEDISSNATAVSVINKQVINAVNTAMTGLRFMGDCPGKFLYKIQTPGIYDLAGKKYNDWGSQLWGQFIVIDAGGNVTTQFIYNNTSNCWVQTCNSWGNTGFKSIY